MIKCFYLTHRLRDTITSGQNEKGTTFLKAPGLEPHHLMVLVSYLGHLLKGEVLALCRDAVSISYSPSQVGCVPLEIIKLLGCIYLWAIL